MSDPSSDCSDRFKKDTSSSSGSVFSDKQGRLPFALPHRVSVSSVKTASSASDSSSSLPLGLEFDNTVPCGKQGLFGLEFNASLPRALLLALKDRQLFHRDRSVLKTPASTMKRYAALSRRTLAGKRALRNVKEVLESSFGEVSGKNNEDIVGEVSTDELKSRNDVEEASADSSAHIEELKANAQVLARVTSPGKTKRFQSNENGPDVGESARKISRGAAQKTEQRDGLEEGDETDENVFVVKQKVSTGKNNMRGGRRGRGKPTRLKGSPEPKLLSQKVAKKPKTSVAETGPRPKGKRSERHRGKVLNDSLRTDTEGEKFRKKTIPSEELLSGRTTRGSRNKNVDNVLAEDVRQGNVELEVRTSRRKLAVEVAQESASKNTKVGSRRKILAGAVEGDSEVEAPKSRRKLAVEASGSTDTAEESLCEISQVGSRRKNVSGVRNGGGDTVHTRKSRRKLVVETDAPVPTVRNVEATSDGIKSMPRRKTSDKQENDVGVQAKGRVECGPEKFDLQSDASTEKAVSSEILLRTGCQVFAQWTDKFYYCGTLQRDQKNGSWEVEFYDNRTCILPLHVILPVAGVQEGQLAFVLVKGSFEAGLVVSVRIGRTTVYTVELDSTNKRVSVAASALRFNDLMATFIREKLAMASPPAPVSPILTLGKTCGLDLDNIVTGVRTRAESKTPTSNVSKTPKSNMSKRKAVELKPSTSGKRPRKLFVQTTPIPVSSDSEPSTKEPFEYTPGLEMDELVINQTKVESGPIIVKGKSKRGTRKGRAKTDELDLKLLGPVPPRGSNIFEGYCFLLTYAKHTPGRVAVSDSEELSTDAEESRDATKLYAEPFPFDEAHLRRQLLAGRGRVYDTFEEVPTSEYDRCFLVTSRPVTTAKYLLCYTALIPIILHMDIRQLCITDQHISGLSTRLGHCGWSLKLQRWLKPSPTCIPTIFADWVVCVYARTNDPDSDLFVRFWSKVLKNTGASVVDSRGVNYAQVIVTEDYPTSCLEEVVSTMGKDGPEIVTTEWITQSLIHCRALSRNLIKEFKHTNTVSS